MEILIKWIGRSVPEAICFLLFTQAFLNIAINKKELLLHSLILGAITLFAPSIFPTQQGPVLIVSVAVYLYVFLVKKKLASTGKTIKPIIYCVALLFASDIVSCGILLYILGISQELITNGDAMTRVLSTIGLLIVYLPITYMVYINKKKNNEKLNQPEENNSEE